MAPPPDPAVWKHPVQEPPPLPGQVPSGVTVPPVLGGLAPANDAPRSITEFAVAHVTPSGSCRPTYAGPPPTSPMSKRSTLIVWPAYAVGSTLKSGILNCGVVAPLTGVNTVMSSIEDMEQFVQFVEPLTVPWTIDGLPLSVTSRTAYPLCASEYELVPVTGLLHGPAVALHDGTPFHASVSTSRR